MEDIIYVAEGYDEFTITEVKKERCTFSGAVVIINSTELRWPQVINNDDPLTYSKWFIDKNEAVGWRKDQAFLRRPDLTKEYTRAFQAYHAMIRATGNGVREFYCEICDVIDLLTRAAGKSAGWVIANGQTFCPECNKGD